LFRGVVDGNYGASTAEAVKRLYKNLGVSAPEAAKSAEAEGQDAEEAKPAAPTLTPVPATEFVSISGTASVAEVASVGAALGENQPFAKLRVGSTTVKARVSVADADAFATGVKVQVFDVTTGQMLSEGNVEAVSEFKAADSDAGASVPGYDITVKLDTTDGLSDGQRVQVKTSERGIETNALALPVTALREKAGKSYVTTKDGTEIEVKVGLILDGYAKIDGEIAEGAEVIISTTGK
ncbi:MAG: hypothetical protein IKZ87_06715, partial [Actinomycetaceae bacterium]|nr:hypothetical protein [Actinomycetaceae bacterium]